MNKYFSGNRVGLGIDARYIYNGVAKNDSVAFLNGMISTHYASKKRFEDFVFSLGPTYRFTDNHFHVEAYLRGGVMLQSFPEFVTTLTYKDTRGVTKIGRASCRERGESSESSEQLTNHKSAQAL